MTIDSYQSKANRYDGLPDTLKTMDGKGGSRWSVVPSVESNSKSDKTPYSAAKNIESIPPRLNTGPTTFDKYIADVPFKVSLRSFLFFHSEKVVISQVDIGTPGKPPLSFTKTDVERKLDDVSRFAVREMPKIYRRGWPLGINMFTTVTKVQLHNENETVKGILQEIRKEYPAPNEVTRKIKFNLDGNVSSAGTSTSITISAMDGIPMLDLTRDHIKTQIKTQLRQRNIGPLSDEMLEKVARTFFNEIRHVATELGRRDEAVLKDIGLTMDDF